MSQKEAMQDVFNRACAGVIAQGEPAGSGTGCRYRMTGQGGKVLKCAIGQILTDQQIEKYAVPEGQNPMVWPDELTFELATGIQDQYGFRNFLYELQRAHDGSSSYEDFVNTFKCRANEVASRFDLIPIA